MNPYSFCLKAILQSSLCIALLLASLNVLAVAPVEALALYKDRAVIRTSDEQVMLKTGETSEGGVTLLTAGPKGATVSYKGETYQLDLSRRVSTRFAEPTTRSLRLNEDELGQYRARGAINNQYVTFLVDTGASVVAMSEQHALSANLNYTVGERGMVQTAQGVTGAHFVVLDEVKVGELTVHGVRAAVIDGNHPPEVLLGMSFLNQLKMENENGVLVLSER